MQRFQSLARVQRQVLSTQQRNAGSVPWHSERWVRQVRAESNTVTPDDPPSKPLPEHHEVGEGQADFSNFIEKHEDVSTRQALTGFGFIMGCMYGIYRYSTKRARESTPVFVPREFPSVAEDIPIWEGKDSRSSTP